MMAATQIRPKMKRRGMFHMKDVTVELATKYEDVLQTRNRHNLTGYLYEVCNLCDGEHTLADIQRILGHELGPMDITILHEMVCDMERMDYLTIGA